MRRSTRHLAVREVTGSRPAVGGRLLELVRGGLVEPRSLLVTLVHEPTLASYVLAFPVVHGGGAPGDQVVAMVPKAPDGELVAVGIDSDGRTLLG